MGFEIFIALRYLLAGRRQAFISVISVISVLGVCLGVASLIVVLGVMNGMGTDLRNKIVGVNAHAVVLSFDSVLRDYQDLTTRVAAVAGVEGVTPFIYSEVMMSSAGRAKGVVLRGIDPQRAAGVLSIGRDMQAGTLKDLEKTQGPPGIIIGAELAQNLSVRPGSLVQILVPSGKKTAAGFVPQVRSVRVVGLFQTGMYEYDSSLAYVSVSAAQALLGFTTDVATGLELKVHPMEEADSIAVRVQENIQNPSLYVRHWKEMNATLYAALELEKTAMFIILTMIVLVGSFSIVTTLVMLVMEKTRDIAILRSMGAGTGSIRRIFILQGMTIGITGTALGFILGLSLCFLLERYQFIQLPEGIYPQNYLTVLIDWRDMAGIGLCALGLCFLATLYPAKQAAALVPAEALSHE